MMTVLFETHVPVSVVIPCYRCSATIRRALGSVAAQTALPQEIILVDDCSADGTVAYLEQLAAEYSPGWIRLLKLSVNGGAGHARDAGWSASTQPYVAFLDADDAWHEKKLEIQYGWMQANDGVFLSGHPSEIVRSGAAPKISVARAPASRVSRRRLLLSNCFSLRSIMIRRELAIRFHPSKRHMEDYWWLLQIAFAGYEIYRIDLPLAYTFKADFGAGGLSANLWPMEKSELDNYWGLWHDKNIGLVTAMLLTCYSLLKYARRLIICAGSR